MYTSSRVHTSFANRLEQGGKILVLLLAVLAPGVFSLGVVQAAGFETIPEDSLFDSMQALASDGAARAPGMPGNEKIEERVQAAFSESGYEHGTLEFSSLVFDPQPALVSFPDGSEIPLDTMHPTLLRPGNFPESDFDAELVYLGNAAFEDVERLKGVKLKDAIAVVEYDCGQQWLRLLRFGIRGIVFLGSDDYYYRDSATKLYTTEVSVPRFFAHGQAAEQLRNAVKPTPDLTAVRIKTEPSRWAPRILRNHWLLIPGADEEVADEVVVITAPMDANSVVPIRSTGGQSLPNLQLLLQMLEDYRQAPPKRSVLLVAVNAHTQHFLGERILAWHLLASRDDVARLRDLISKQLRVTNLYWTNYRKLKLAPCDMAPDKLHVAMEVLWQLDAMQAGAREEEYQKKIEERQQKIEELKRQAAEGETVDMPIRPERDEILHLEPFVKEDYYTAIDNAIVSIRKEAKGITALITSDDEAIAKIEDDVQRLQQFKEIPFDELKATLLEAKPVFDDEKLLEKWRTEMDRSTGVRLYVKAKLQDEAGRVLNRLKMQMLEMSQNESMPQEEKERLRKEMMARKEDLTKVLVLFNKINVGVGRGKTTYRQIAANEAQRKILKGYRDRLVNQFEVQTRQKRAALERDTQNDVIRDALGSNTVKLVLNLNANWRSATKFGFCSINGYVQNDWESGFGKLSMEIAKGLDNDDAASAPEIPLEDTLTKSGGHPQDFYFPDSGNASTYFHQAGSTPSFTLKNVHSSPGLAFSPADALEDLPREQVTHRFNWLREYLPALIDDPALTASNTLAALKLMKNSKLWSCMISAYSIDEFSSKTTPDQPIPESLLAIYPTEGGSPAEPLPPLIAGDVVNCYSGLTDEAGQSIIYALRERSTVAPLAYQLDDNYHTVRNAIDKGQIQSSAQMTSNITRNASKTLPMLACNEFVIADRLDPSLISHKPITVDTLMPKTAAGKSEPKKFGLHGVAGPSGVATHVSYGPVGVYRWRKGIGAEKEPLIVLTGDNRGALNPTEKHKDGAGYEDPSALSADFFAVVARDMDKLNRFRLAEMKGVTNQLIDDFLANGKVALQRMEELRGDDHNQFLIENYKALGNETKAYQQLRGINADMLKAILMYMALMLPFCFFIQKLLFSFTRMEHEVLAFVLLFVAIYVGFRFIHPAFAIAMSPEAIFIGFLLAAIGLFTVWMLHSRFEGEMNLLFSSNTGMESDVSYGTVGQTAMVIGVNNMKRRRIRTSLTTATIVLVTFTMLAFSSVSNKMKPTIIQRAEDAPYTGMFYKWPGGQPMDEATAEAFENMFSGRADVLVRRTLPPPKGPQGETLAWNLARTEESTRTIPLKGVIGLPPADENFLGPFPLIRGRYFSSAIAPEIILTAGAAEGLGVEPEDVGKTHLRFQGHDLLLAGIIDDERYRLRRDLDPNFFLLPLKEKSQSGGQGGQRGAGEKEGAEAGAVPIDTAALALLPDKFAQKMGAKPLAISVRFRNEAVLAEETDRLRLWRELDTLLTVTQAKVFIGSQTDFVVGTESDKAIAPGIYYVGSSYKTSIGGFSRLFIPLLIAGSIILNTMLGTVYERKSEIAVYNAIGLNPTHIFLFFLAEAFVYSVVGSVAGYLIGQVASMVLQTFQLVPEVNINFSSLMVMYAILLTIALVLLSTIYPALVATRTAVPSGKRKWSMPEHDGKKMNVVFPFIYQPNLAPGVMHYLYEYFSLYTEQSMGEQIATFEGIDIKEDEKGRPVYRLTYDLALVPLDLGVTQRVTFKCQFDEVVDSYRIEMLNERLSGQDTNWVTTNMPFLERLRKLLIRWRNIDTTQHKYYVDQGRDLYGLKQ